MAYVDQSYIFDVDPYQQYKGQRGQTKTLFALFVSSHFSEKYISVFTHKLPFNKHGCTANPFPVMTNDYRDLPV